MSDAQAKKYKIHKWGRLRLPNGQIATSKWREDERRGSVRRARNVLVGILLFILSSMLISLQQLMKDEMEYVAEMIFYTSISVSLPNGGTEEKIVGLASFYGDPDAELHFNSFETYWTSHHEHRYEFIDVKCIKEVVMMAPDPRYHLFNAGYTGDDRWYMMRKPGAAFAQNLS